MLLTTSCGVCARPGPSPCRSCLAQLSPAPRLAPPDGVDAVLALCCHDRAGRALVHAVKYRNCRATARWVARALARRSTPWLATVDEPWAITWAPTTVARRRERGFDQAERLARLLGRQVGRRPARLLTRAPGPVQTGRSAAERRFGPRFEVVRRCPPLVVVVDDVVTTGSTAAAAAEALRRGGARHVRFLTVSRTPLKASTPRADASLRCR